MRKPAAVAVVFWISVFACSSSIAWEFSLNGEYENRIRWFSRTGENDLFGTTRVQGAPSGAMLVGFAGPNVYNTGALPTVPAPTSNFMLNLGNATGRQMLITRGGFSSSGSDAYHNDSRLTLRPTIRVNQAVAIRSVLNFGGFRNKYNETVVFSGAQANPPLERYYVSEISMNATDTAALISVEQFWATVNFPWGRFAMGARNLPFGTGATLGLNTRSGMFLLSVPYGPFRFMFGIWPGRSRLNEGWATVPDGTQKDNVFQGYFVTYENSVFSLGATSILRRFHGNNTAPYLTLRDDNTWINLVYLKYFDGRFFANAEYSWLNLERYRSLAPEAGEDVLGSQSQTLFIEGYHFFGELGAIVGPAKLTLMCAGASGPVLNTSSRLRNVYAGGYFLGSSTPAPFAPGANPKVYTPWVINYQALEPYEVLMFNTYAGGNNGGWNALDYGMVADEHGMMADAYCLGARLDFAVASNLNLWASYLWAHRLERYGTYFGQYQSSGSLAAGSIPNLRAFYSWAGRTFGAGADYVSNGFIGWEMNCGVDWKLLEGFTAKIRYSYWQPGEWFREAYQSVVLRPGGRQVTTTGVLESRDAIHALQTSFSIDF